MDWEFSEDQAFLALSEAFLQSGEDSALEFLANAEGAFYYQDLIQNAAGEGVDLGDSDQIAEFQQEIIELMEFQKRSN